LASPLAGLDRKRLRLWLGLFFLALALPTAILTAQAVSQLKWEAFHQYQALAEELAARINGRLIALIRGEGERPFEDYGFLLGASQPATFPQRSPLAAFPVKSDIPGLLGYFQVDATGAFSTPILPPPDRPPAAYGIDPAELAGRRALADRIRTILSSNRLVEQPAATPAQDQDQAPLELEARRSLGSVPPPRPAERARPKAAPPSSEPMAQAAFDRLNAPGRAQGQARQRPGALGRVEDLKLDLRFQKDLAEAPAAAPAGGGSRARNRPPLAQDGTVVRAHAPSPGLAKKSEAAPSGDARVHLFASELGPFELSRLDSGQLVLYRNVWRHGGRYIQGALIEQGPFLNAAVESLFRETILSRLTELVVAYQGTVLAAFSAQPGREYLTSARELGGALLYRTRLVAPLSALELLFTVNRLPLGPGGRVIAWTAVTLVLVLCGGCFLMYRVGLRQIALARQQQDFVSAVSHELKTPLTSIRMYGEMLKEGWAPAERRQTYFDFICAESERLTRLIENVLQLARLTRNELRVDLKPLTVGELMDGLRPQIATLVERAGFALRLDCAAPNVVMLVDQDFFAQILINLVDNALKFSRDATQRVVEIGCRMCDVRSVRLCVRDYGPGIPRNQMKKIFRLFYRPGTELTRETVGTGIGLALVRQLTIAMNGRVAAVNRDPGAELQLTFPVVPSGAPPQGGLSQRVSRD
jgi:two-component system phosphate regulon sensor histidine kinase PhoR